MASRLIHSKFFMAGVNVKKYTHDHDMWDKLGVPKDMGKSVSRQEWDPTNLGNNGRTVSALKTRIYQRV